MWKKLIWGIVVLELIISWPLSLIKKPAYFNQETIFYPITENEKWVFEKELSLDTSRFKKFYYNKTTIVKDRYIKNFLVMMDLNNYFFMMHPREDVSGVDYRFKYPFIAILFLVLAIKITAEDKKYLKVWGIMIGIILGLSFFKQIDGWDLILYFPITFLLISGSGEINKWKLGWVINLILIILMTVEIWRILV